MKKALILSAALVALTASMASAQTPGINYSLTDCGTFGTQDATNACTSNSGSIVTVGSVIAPAGVDHMVAMEAVVDAQTSGATLSPWWQMNTGECRQGAVVLNADFTGGPFSCTDYWAGAGIIVGGIDPNHSGPNRFRIKVVCALPAEQAIDQTENYMFKASILKSKSVGTGSCAGCLDACSLVLNEIRLDQPAGVGDFRIFTDRKSVV